MASRKSMAVAGKRGGDVFAKHRDLYYYGKRKKIVRIGA